MTIIIDTITNERREVESIELAYSVAYQHLLSEGMTYAELCAHVRTRLADPWHSVGLVGSSIVRHTGRLETVWYVVVDGITLGRYEYVTERYTIDVDWQTIPIVEGAWAKAGGPTPARFACCTALG